MNLQQLIDQRYELERGIEAAKRKLDELDGEILTLMLEAGEKKAYGSYGGGYSIGSSTKYEFNAGAYRYLEEKGLLSHFTPPPKITKGKLDALVKEGELDYTDMAAIEPFMTVEQSPYSLRKVAAEKNNQ